MHGQNAVRPLETNALLQVAEVFYTIQGEGPYSGMPAVFVRLSGCNLRCHFCDTVWDDENDPRMTQKYLLDKILEVSEKGKLTKLLVLTGGEPVRQDCTDLVSVLVEHYDWTVQVETAGTYWAPWLTMTKVVCSPKTAFVHPRIHDFCNDWKYIMRFGEVSFEDGLPGMPTQVKSPELMDMTAFTIISAKYGLPCRPPKDRKVTVWLSPCDEGPGPEHYEANANNMGVVRNMCLRFGYRAQLQIHKYLQVP